MTVAHTLTKRVLIQKPSEAGTQDAAGQPSTDWVDVFMEGDHKVYAAINPLKGQELIAAQAEQSEVSHKITVRYRSQLANPLEVAKMRAVFGERIFNIYAAINRNESGRWVDLMCSEGLNEG